jgi:hypothetical protein
VTRPPFEVADIVRRHGDRVLADTKLSGELVVIRLFVAVAQLG